MSEARGSLPRLLSYLALGALAAGLAWLASGLPASRWEPLGAGTFPAMVFAALALLCGIGAVGEILARPALASSVGEWLHRQRLVIFVLASFALYVLVLPWLGFAPATCAFLLITQLRLAPRRPGAWLLAALLAVLFSFGLAWLFANAFNIFLPRPRLWG